MTRTPGGSLVPFFVLTYAVMWACFITVAALAIPVASPLGTSLVLLAYSPALVALSPGALMRLEPPGTTSCSPSSRR